MSVGRTSSAVGAPLYSFKLRNKGRLTHALMTGLIPNVVAVVAYIKKIIHGLLKVLTVPWNCMNG